MTGDDDDDVDDDDDEDLAPRRAFIERHPKFRIPLSKLFATLKYAEIMDLPLPTQKELTPLLRAKTTQLPVSPPIRGPLHPALPTSPLPFFLFCVSRTSPIFDIISLQDEGNPFFFVFRLSHFSTLTLILFYCFRISLTPLLLDFGVFLFFFLGLGHYHHVFFVFCLCPSTPLFL